MSLFQPTNIAPSVFGQPGSGVVDATNDLTVSWQVNGNSPMTAYQIDILTNDTANGLIYSTGKVTNNCPFYGVTSTGNIQLFSHTIPVSALPASNNTVTSVGVSNVYVNYEQFIQKVGSQSGTFTFYYLYTQYEWKLVNDREAPAVNLSSYGIYYSSYPSANATITVTLSPGFSNGSSYKTKITQWWSETQSIEQIDANVFYTKATPTLTLSAIPDPVTSRTQTFSAVYSQEQGDGLRFVQWQIALATNIKNPFFDTGKVFGTAQTEITYDGFFPNTNYAVCCTIETESGVSATTGWTVFPVNYPVSDLITYVDAFCFGNDGIKVEWNKLSFIIGEATGTYSIEDDTLNLEENASVRWDEENSDPMNFNAPWSLFYQGQLKGENVTLFELETESNNITANYNATTRKLSLRYGTEILAEQSTVYPSSYLTIVLTPETLYIRTKYLTGGLYPSNTLYPGNSLFPAEDDVETIDVYQHAITYTQSAISACTLYGSQVCEWFYIMKGTPTSGQINSAMNGTFAPTFDENAYFCADFTDGLNAGILRVDNPVTQFSIYRKETEKSELLKIATVDLSNTQIIDNGVVLNKNYTYYVFPETETESPYAPIISNSASVCYWDWILLECQKQTDGIYFMVNKFRFGLNLETGSISNNNNPNVLQNFTPYPLVQRSPSNYKSGSLTSLIGGIKQDGTYYDTSELRDEISGLSTRKNDLFLKNRKGDLWKVALSAEISFETMDATKSQAQTATISWVEIGSADGASIIIIPEVDNQ